MAKAANIQSPEETPNSEKTAPANINDPAPSTIRKQLDENWSKLHPNIQERFARNQNFLEK